jgi:hypothetical protein
VVFWSSLGDVGFSTEQEEFDWEFMTVFVKEPFVFIVSLLGERVFSEAKVEDDL